MMKLDPITAIISLAAARACSRRDWLPVLTLSLIVTTAFLLQGCLAGAWVALVTLDTVRSSNDTVGSFEQSWVAQVAVNTRRSSNVTFGSFEQSWVAQQSQPSDGIYNQKVTSIAVLPAEGDPEMGARLASLLQQETTLRVKLLASIAAGVTTSDPRSAKADDAHRRALAKAVTQDLGVDTILVSRITEPPSHPSDWGRKAERSRRLYLYLVDHDGRLLWKDELPFTLAQASTQPMGRSAQIDFTHHVIQQVKALHLDELGYLPNKEKRRKSNRPSATLTPIQ
jgi:hypothetical protein